MTEFKIRSFPPRNDLADAYHIQLSPTELVRHHLQPGDVCWLQCMSSGQRHLGIAWASKQKLDPAVARVTTTFSEAQDLKHSERYTLGKGDQDQIQPARSIVFTEIQEGQGTTDEPNVTENTAEWSTVIKAVHLKKLKYVFVGMVFHNITCDKLPGMKKTFRLHRISPSSRHGSLHRCCDDVDVSIQPLQSLGDEIQPEPVLLEGEDHIGGLHQAIDKIKCMLRSYVGDEVWPESPCFQARFTGMLLCGPPGTGKSLLQRKIAGGDVQALYASWTTLSASGNPISEMNRIFNAAAESAPSVLLIDSLERMGESPDRLSYLISALERLEGSAVLVIASTSDRKQLDRYKDLSKFFAFEVETPPPGPRDRAEILKILMGLPKDAAHPLLDGLADHTHGYVGRDLDKIVQHAVAKAKRRVRDGRAEASRPTEGHDETNAFVDGSHNAPSGPDFANGNGVVTAYTGERPQDDPSLDGPMADDAVFPTEAEFYAARDVVRPSAMHEVFLEVPKVSWSDIGGQDDIKEGLIEAVQWPMMYPELFGSDCPPQKGVLLYGPPGCSKTMIAKAIANEVGLNFLAVKGAEILNKYVGESERNLRDLFSKARAAAPSILFFDEIDSIGRGADSGGSSGVDLHVVTTFLNEMDGIEDLKGVFVLAATNRPEILDQALIRPGRLGLHLYVGPPNQAARSAILGMHLGKTKLEDVSLEWLAEQTEGYSGAEVVEVCSSAKRILRREVLRAGARDALLRKHFEKAMDVVVRQITPDMVDGYMAFKNRR